MRKNINFWPFGQEWLSYLLISEFNVEFCISILPQRCWAKKWKCTKIWLLISTVFFHFSRKPIHFMNKIVVSRVIYKYLMSFEMDFQSAFNNIPVFIWWTLVCICQSYVAFSDPYPLNFTFIWSVFNFSGCQFLTLWLRAIFLTIIF